MSFEESLVMVSPFPIIQEEEEEEEEEDDGFNKIRNSLSRLSICTTSVYDNNNKNEEEEDKEPTKNQTYDFGVSMSECFDGAEADGEVSDDGGGRRGKENVHVHVSDSDQEIYSLPVTPSHRRSNKLQDSGEFDTSHDGKKCNLRNQRRVNKEKKKKKKRNGFNGVDGESDGVGLTMLTRAKGGEKSLRMGLEEVKACRDLGFELEPGRISVSTGSNFDTPHTSSGNNSPIAAWRISSPGNNNNHILSPFSY